MIKGLWQKSNFATAPFLEIKLSDIGYACSIVR